MCCAVLCLVTLSSLTLCDPMDCSLPGSSVRGDSPGKNTGVGCHALLQEIFPTRGSNPGLPHSRQILYCLSHQGSPRVLEWVAYSFSRGTSQPENRSRVSCIAGGFFFFLPAELPGKPRFRYAILLFVFHLSHHFLLSLFLLFCPLLGMLNIFVFHLITFLFLFQFQ